MLMNSNLFFSWAGEGGADGLLVMDPDMFLLDTFRVPGFNGLMARNA